MMAGRIYKVFYDDIEECYVGQTRMIPVQRLVHHINAYHANKQDRQCGINALFIEHGVHTAQIKVLETLETCTDQELWDRERYWIENTPGAINRNKPQPMETNQRTSEGKQAYMLAYRAANEDVIKAKEAEYKARPDVKARATEQKREWTKANSECINAKKKERIICDKCNTHIPVSHKHEHTSEKCNKIISDETVRQEYRLKANELSKTLTLRDIVKHPYFIATGKFKNHSEISRLLKELSNR
jgi:hypothetical protein